MITLQAQPLQAQPLQAQPLQAQPLQPIQPQPARRTRSLVPVLLLFGLAAAISACATDDSAIGTVQSPVRTAPDATRVVFGDGGKLGGAMVGYAWVAAGSLATVEAPNPCNDQGCFTSTEGGLCTRGSLPELVCASPDSWDCNYSANWGVMVGLNPRAQGEGWGPEAPRSLSIAYAGGPGKYRLTAHIAGDPVEKTYCIEDYVSGLSVEANSLKSECWSSGGAPLPSFAVVDRIGLMLVSGKTAIPFDFCVSSVSLNGPVDRGRVLVGGHGKLSGAMDGYSWVAAGPTATITSPNPCTHQGCFHDTGGRLCTTGSLPALSCTGHGTEQFSCDWTTNWGAMIGMNPTTAHAAWGDSAPGRVSVAYSGSPGSYRLTAHVAGDPMEKTYCIRDYVSGQEVTAATFRTNCWDDSGVALRSFADVDSLGLLLTPAEAPIDFDYCISAISAR